MIVSLPAGPCVSWAVFGCGTWCSLCWDSQVVWGEFKLFRILFRMFWRSCLEARVLSTLAFSLRVGMQVWFWQKAFKAACGTVAVWGAGPGAPRGVYYCLEVGTWIWFNKEWPLCIRAWTEENARRWMSTSFVVAWSGKLWKWSHRIEQGRKRPSESGVLLISGEEKKTYSCTILHKFCSLKNWDV